jgi:hypothetical protein
VSFYVALRYAKGRWIASAYREGMLVAMASSADSLEAQRQVRSKAEQETH